MSNFSNSIKYVGNILSTAIFPVETIKNCATAHLFGFTQQSGLLFRPQMVLQDVTHQYMVELGNLVRSSTSINHVPILPSHHATINIPLLEEDNPANGVKQYSAYNSHLKRIRKNQKVRGDD